MLDTMLFFLHSSSQNHQEKKRSAFEAGGTIVGRVAIQFRSNWNNVEVGKGSAVHGSMTRTSSGEIMIGLAKELPATAVT